MVNEKPITEEQRKTVERLRQDLKGFNEPSPPYFSNMKKNVKKNKIRRLCVAE